MIVIGQEDQCVMLGESKHMWVNDLLPMVTV